MRTVLDEKIIKLYKRASRNHILPFLNTDIEVEKMLTKSIIFIFIIPYAIL